jgi:hypothetical protein
VLTSTTASDAVHRHHAVLPSVFLPLTRISANLVPWLSELGDSSEGVEILPMEC